MIQKENDFYLQILQQALPDDLRYPEKPKGIFPFSKYYLFGKYVHVIRGIKW